jgi:hypothetical protein
MFIEYLNNDIDTKDPPPFEILLDKDNLGPFAYDNKEFRTNITTV